MSDKSKLVKEDGAPQGSHGIPIEDLYAASGFSDFEVRRSRAKKYGSPMASDRRAIHAVFSKQIARGDYAGPAIPEDDLRKISDVERAQTFDDIVLWMTPSQETLAVGVLKLSDEIHEYSIIAQWGDDGIDVAEIRKKNQRKLKRNKLVYGKLSRPLGAFASLAALCLILGMIIINITLWWLIPVGLLMFIAFVYIAATSKVDSRSANLSRGGALASLVLFIDVVLLVVLLIEGINDAHTKKHTVDALVCKISHNAPGDHHEEDYKDDWWVETPQGVFNLQAGEYANIFYDASNTNNGVKVGKTYRFTYHGGNLSSPKFVTNAVPVNKSLGQCGS